MKIIGAVLIIVGSVAAGMVSVMKLHRRVEYISGIISTLTFIKNEICTSLTPMYDALNDVLDSSHSSVKKLYMDVVKNMKEIGEKSFGDIWRKSVEKCCKGILDSEEISVLAEVGQSLGKYDVEWQKEALNRALKRFEVFERDAISARDKDSKAHAMLGFAAGIFAVIILV